MMHDKIDKEGHDQSAIEMTTACAASIEQLAALVHRIHMTFNVTDVYITSDHGFLFEDKMFEEKDKHQVIDADIEKKTRYYLTTSEAKQMGITQFRLEDVSGMVAPDVYVAVPNGTNRMMAAGGYNFAHGGGALQEIITPLIHSKQVRKETRQKVTVSLTGNNNLTLVSSMVKFALLQNEPKDASLRALVIKYGIYVNGTIAGNLEEKTLDSKSDAVANRVSDITIRMTSVPVANAIIELRVYDAEDLLNPIISRNVKNGMAGMFDEVDF
ncbi:MAG: PglZ domain-containing protein [Erysipelotrichaceae bacterium]|nr:PglZ domain-containing protein [Erysipelotrichaceae bacterium]